MQLKCVSNVFIRNDRIRASSSLRDNQRIVHGYFQQARHALFLALLKEQPEHSIRHMQSRDEFQGERFMDKNEGENKSALNPHPNHNSDLKPSRVLHVLVELGVDIEECIESTSRSTALMVAAKLGLLEILETLIALDVDLEFKDTYSRTALLLACNAGKVECVAALLKAGADTRVTDRTGSNVLHHACASGTEAIAMLDMLLDARRHEAFLAPLDTFRVHLPSKK